MSSKPVNMMEALGIPDPKGPTKAPPDVALNVMQLAAKYLLYERSEETAITAAFAQVVEERHNHFHVKPFTKNPIHWTQCDNQVCKEARNIIASTKQKEVNINPIAATLMSEYIINFMPMPNNLRLWLSKKSETQLPETEDQKRQASRIILAS